MDPDFAAIGNCSDPAWAACTLDFARYRVPSIQGTIFTLSWFRIEGIHSILGGGSWL